jgi:uncharacterized protein (UPF0335 family)
MEIKSSEQAREGVIKYTKRYVELLKQKKTIDQDIKALKQEFAEEGVPAGVVSSLISKIKADLKKSDAEKFELDTMRDWIESVTEIVEDLQELNAK